MFVGVIKGSQSSKKDSSRGLKTKLLSEYILHPIKISTWVLLKKVMEEAEMCIGHDMIVTMSIGIRILWYPIFLL